MRTVALIEGQEALETAFATIAAATDPNQVPDAQQFMAFGGAIGPGSDDYVESFLEMVNHHLHADTVARIETASGEHITIKLGDESIYWIETLDQILKDPLAVIRRNAKKWNEEIQGRILCVPIFWDVSGTDAPTYRMIAMDSIAATVYALRLTATKPFCDRLRRCELSECRKFFLYSPRKPVAHRRYCCAEHSSLASRAKMLKRVHKFRHPPKVNRSRRAK